MSVDLEAPGDWTMDIGHTSDSYIGMYNSDAR